MEEIYRGNGVLLTCCKNLIHPAVYLQGAPDTSERVVPQAGQVWFPDSALKTAHAMEEFDREGLPLIIMANWRGFSGGQRDLFEGVLQVWPPWVLQ